jgi:magnesium transporter
MNAAKEIVNCVAYAEGLRVADVPLSEVSMYLNEENQFVWIGLNEPSEAILSQVKQHFHLHELAVEDAHRAHQRPKVEQYGHSIFVVVRTAQMPEDSKTIEFGEVHFFVGTDFIVVVRHGFSTPFTEVRANCEGKPGHLRKGQGFVLYAVMDFIVDHYFPVMQRLEKELENLENRIFKQRPTRETTEQIYDLKWQILEIKRAIWPLADICNWLMRCELDFVSPETRPYFRDVYDHVMRINEMIDISRELLSGAMEANFSLISISQSEVAKKFGGWAAIVAIPTMVAGFYGMNFRVIPVSEWQYGYYLVVFATFGICALLYYYFKRSGWF